MRSTVLFAVVVAASVGAAVIGCMSTSIVGMDSRAGADAGGDADADGDADSDADADSDTGAIPAEACADDHTADRETCDSAWIIGRAAVIDDIAGETYGSGGDIACGSGEGTGLDQFYRIFLLAGETLDVTMTDPNWEIDPVLALYRSATAGSGTGCDTVLECVDDVTSGAESFAYTADASGWYAIVADSNNSYPDLAYDSYALRVSIDCSGSCGC